MPRDVTPMPFQCHFCTRPISEMMPLRVEAGFLYHKDCPRTVDDRLVPLPDPEEGEDW